MALVVTDADFEKLRDVHLDVAAAITGWRLEAWRETTWATSGRSAP